MPYVYHAVPHLMKGTVLYPLNELKDREPALYDAHSTKYEGRKHLMKERIPLLDDCLWNDVLFLTAVHPAKFRKAYESAGFALKHPFQAFQFEVEDLAASSTAVLMTMASNNPRSFEAFDPSRMEQYDIIPQATFDYWQRERAAGGTRPFLYLHILYRGRLDTTAATLIEA
jgi:hypothetical protein